MNFNFKDTVNCSIGIVVRICNDMLLIADIGDSEIALISLYTGGMVSTPTKVVDIYSIKKGEWYILSQGSPYKIVIDGEVSDKEFSFSNIDRVCSIGKRVRFRGSDCIIAQVLPKEVALIDLIEGNRFLEPILVYDPYSIKEAEWDRISGGHEYTIID